jgi:hypothetical protein
MALKRQGPSEPLVQNRLTPDDVPNCDECGKLIEAEEVQDGDFLLDGLCSECRKERNSDVEHSVGSRISEGFRLMGGEDG